jgi:hypothetical protein
VINWLWVGVHALWIIGLAVLLATFSYRSVVAVHEKASPRRGLGGHKRRLFFRLGVLLLALSLCATSNSSFERGIWGILFLVTLFEPLIRVFPVWHKWEMKRSTSTHGDERETSETQVSDT